MSTDPEISPRRTRPILLAGIGLIAGGVLVAGGYVWGNAAAGSTEEADPAVSRLHLEWPDDLDTALTECAQYYPGSEHAVVPMIHEADGRTVNWGEVECYGTGERDDG